MNCRFALALLLLVAYTPSFAQYDEESDFPPGILATYQSGGQTIKRIEADLSFDWGQHSPDGRLPDAPFTAHWQTDLLIRQDTQHQFHVYLQGEVALSLAGKQIITGRQTKPGWLSSQPIKLDFGEQKLEMTFRKIARSARIHLFWSSDRFDLEPVPYHLFFRDGGNPELASIERGRELYEAHRCNRCHQRKNELASPAAPALSHLGKGTDPNWLIEKISKTSSFYAQHAQMPAMDVSTAESNAIVAYLTTAGEPVKLASTPKSKKETADLQAGQKLVYTLGCLACHQLGEYGNNHAFGGGSFNEVGEKRTKDWFYTWLKAPANLNPTHRMPIFKLSGAERRQIALFLSTQTQQSVPPYKPVTKLKSDPNQIAKGKQLLEQFRCAACHQIPGVKADLTGIPQVTAKNIRSKNTCVQVRTGLAKKRPSYRRVTAEQKRDLLAYLKSRGKTNSVISRFEQGKHLLNQKACIDCHPRDHSKGITQTAGKVTLAEASLKGLSQGFIPPALTAVGDKMFDDALADALSGNQKTVRLPWLLVRMPRFKHTKAQQQALLTYLIGHDRIPPGAPETLYQQLTKQAQQTKSIDKAERLIAGRELVGGKGFSCVACHKFGDYEPKNTALGTRGSDMLMLGKRMRKSFYMRWTRSPLRIVPGMEMPSYNKPKPNVLDGHIETQLAAIWDAVNDERFTVPTNPSVVEQFLYVKPGEPARIIRDVFTSPDPQQKEPIARAFAVGFNNGHNFLFDLDNMALRGWTIGDFARQRTIGKSWYWDLAGQALMTGFDSESDWVLVNNKTGQIIMPVKQHGMVGRLYSYNNFKQGSAIAYSVHFKIDGQLHAVNIMEHLLPVLASNNGENKKPGWQRNVEASELPTGYRLQYVVPKKNNTIGNPTIEVKPSGPRDITIRYLTTLQSPPLELKPQAHPALKVEPVTSTPGFAGVRLPIRRKIMPTAMTWLKDGTLAFTSLEGHVYLARDTDGDGIENQLTLFEEGLSAPYGIMALGDDLIVSHKPELILLSDTDADGRADDRKVMATGWGFNDNYHDWTCGIVKDSHGNMFVGLGSDYAQKKRPKEQARWRGKVLKIDPHGSITPFAHAMRYPTGIAINSKDQIFTSDNQGVQNTFNELNYVQFGKHYGVPSRHEEVENPPETRAAVQIPHPWTRSVNGLFAIPMQSQLKQPLASQLAEITDHIIGCEYNHRLLVRMSLQPVGGTLQGAAYYMSLPNVQNESDNFLGPLCGAVSPNGDIYIGSIHDSGWLGGLNTGEIVRLRPNGKRPNGIRELRATPDGFEIEFFEPIHSAAAKNADNYSLSGYTRVWQGSYATEDSGRYKPVVQSISVSADGRTVTLTVDALKEKFVYEVSCNNLQRGAAELWPKTGHYTMNQIPK